MSYQDGWLPDYDYVYNPRTGGTYDPEGEGYPWAIVLHSIESEGLGNPATHPYPPHLWYNRKTRQKIQTVNCLYSAYALYQSPTAPYYTNRARRLQCEISGYAADAANWTTDEKRGIAENVVVPFVRFVRAQGSDIDLSDAAVYLPGAIPGSANPDAPQRLEPVVWAFGPIGLVAHRHVPMGDDHWDAGALNLREIAQYAKEILGDTDPTSPVPTQPKRIKEKDMEFKLRMNPNTNEPVVDDGKQWGFSGPVNYYDFPLVPASCKVTVSGKYPEVPNFNAVVVIANEAKSVQSPQLVKWGLPSQTVVKSDSFVTVVVPHGFACWVVAVG